MNPTEVAENYNRSRFWYWAPLVAWVGMAVLIAYGFWLIRDNRLETAREIAEESRIRSEAIVAEGRARALANCEAQNEQQADNVEFIRRIGELEGTDLVRQQLVAEIAAEVYHPRNCKAELRDVIRQVEEQETRKREGAGG